MEGPGRAREFVLAAVRVLVGSVFVVSGALRLLDHEGAARRLDDWGVPAPDVLAWVVGGLEVGAGLVLVLGLSSRLAALLLLLVMLAGVATAGRTDGGRYLVVPPLLALACLVIVARGGGAGQLLDRLDPPNP